MSIAEDYIPLARKLARNSMPKRIAFSETVFDDLLSDAMLGLTKASVKWDGTRPFAPFATAWILGEIAKGKRARSGCRSDRLTNPQPMVPLDAAPAVLRDASPGPAEVAEARALWRAVDQLPDPRLGRIVRLHYQFDYSQREIAGVLGCSQMHVSRLLRTALASLAEKLGHAPLAA